MEILRKVGRQEEELQEREKFTISLTTPHAPPPKRKREEPDKGFNTKYEKRNRTIKLEKDLLDRKLLEITPQKIKLMPLRRTSIPIGKRHTMESRTMWLKN